MIVWTYIEAEQVLVWRETVNWQCQHLRGAGLEATRNVRRSHNKGMCAQVYGGGGGGGGGRERRRGRERERESMWCINVCASVIMSVCVSVSESV